MDENKYWWQSRAVFGGLVAIGAGVAGMIGYTIDSDMQEGLVAACTGIAAGIGGILAIVGRVKASKRIK
jgi:hypothetical protein